MSNPLYNALGGGSMPGGMGNLLQQFNQFRQNFKGDPRQQVQELLNSGRMTQAQYSQLQSMAQQIARFLK